ncbi:MAG: hypothetical protein IPN37_03310 [Betaproteobacteria bacterium]|nr:hypothetical protein [Betaproteobacteria bacterium]
MAAHDLDGAAFDLRQHLLDAVRACGFVAVHRAGDDEPRPRRQAGETVRAGCAWKAWPARRHSFVAPHSI